MNFRGRAISRRVIALFLPWIGVGVLQPEPTPSDIEALFFQVDELPAEAKASKVKEILRLRSPHAAPFLLKLLADAEDFDLIRQEVLAGVELSVDQNFLEEVDALAASEHPAVRAESVRALGHVPGPAVTQKLAELAGHKDPGIRSAALAALGERPRAGAIPLLKKSLERPPETAAELVAAQRSLERQERALKPVPAFHAATIDERAPIAVATEKDVPAWARPSEWHLVGLGFGGSVGGSEWQLAPRPVTPQSIGDGLEPLLDGCPLLAVLPLGEAFAESLFGSEENRRVLRDFLARGGWVFFEPGSLGVPAGEWLHALKLPVPAASEDKAGPPVVCADDEFHPILDEPFKLARSPVEKSFVVTWSDWDRSRALAPWRSSSRPDHAAMLLYPGVLGRGTVVLSGIADYLALPEARHNLYARVFGPEKTWAERGHFEVSAEVVTPHRAWAQPLFHGPLRCLFILSRHAQREMLELAQRIQLDADVVPLIDAINGSHQERWGPWAFNRSPRDRYTAAAPTHLMLDHYWSKPYEVIIVGNYSGYLPANLPRRSDWDLFPEWMKARILRRVSEGAGLVLIGLPGQVARYPVAEGLELSPAPDSIDLAWPGRQAGELARKVSCAQLGRGRIAVFTPGVHFVRGSELFLGPEFQIPGALGPWMRFPEEDYVYSALAKVILWASGRPDPPACIGSLEDTGEAVRIRLTPVPLAVAELEIHLAIRNRFGETVHRSKRPAKDPDVPLPLPPLPAGAFVADLQLRGPDDAVLDWAALRLLRNASPRWAEIRADRELYEPGQTASVTARIQGEVPAGARIAWFLEDSSGRRVVQGAQELPPAARDFSLSVPIENLLSTRSLLRLSLISGQSVSDDGVLPLYVILPENRQHFSFALVEAETYGEIARIGVDTVDFPVAPRLVDQAIEAGLKFHVGWAYLQCTIGTPSKFPADGVRSPCLSSPTFERGIRQSLERVIPPLRRLGVRSFELQDETNFGGPYCFSPHCLARFRRWLGEQYASLDRLNQSWGSRFKAWPEVQPLRLEEAVQAGHVASWLDHRTFMESVVAGWVELAQNCIREQIPDARVGLSGTYGVQIGSFDWWKLSRVCSVIIKYGEARGNSFHRSFDRGDLSLGNWGRYAYDLTDHQESSCRYGPWLALLEGENTFWFWGGYIAVRSDLRPYRALSWCAEEVREIQSGIDAFCLGQTESAPVAIHYSQNSLQLHHALSPSVRQPDRVLSWNGFAASLRELGLSSDFVSYEQVERGELRSRGIRLLYLPCSLALSDAEIQALREFVEDGGILVADFPPGGFDRHGSPRTGRGLEECFGVRFGPRFAEAVQPVPLRLNLEFQRSAITTSLGDSRLVLDGGQALGQAGDAPAFVLRPLGRGKAVLLNFHPALGLSAAATASGVANPADDRPLRVFRRELVHSLLQLAGIEPAARILEPGDEPFSGDFALFRRGENRILGFGRGGAYGPVAGQKPYEVTVRLDQARSVYDVRRRRFLGHVRSFTVSATPAVAELYSLLPYEVQKLSVVPEGTLQAGLPGRFHAALVTSAPPGEHAFSITVTDAQGRTRREYAGDWIASAGQATFSIPFALNDPPGGWKLTVRDVLSGLEAQAAFTLSPP
ncbi:MAG: HEAT repeat domain-containing protein [Planctomycetes bacterium]|nr:HEAT repeat domain-containing protein [Planctomycetota bacterium]